MPQSQLVSSNEEQQEKLLDESLSIIKVQSFHMKCCLDKGQLMEALKHASNMLSELRTSFLGPKAYYELYMAVTDQLRHLELFLVDEFERDNKIFELYEMVQYAGNIIPRLYLLISIGLVYMKTSPSCRKEILRDLVEMCRGVQHPLRGLFLRNFLLQTCRHVLPDVPAAEGSIGPHQQPNPASAPGGEDGCQPTQYVSSTLSHDPNLQQANGELKAGDTGTVMDSIEFVLANFAEMNKLWVRMQHLGHTRERERREKERLELRLLVGTNLVRLSQLESIDMALYSKVVLPGILEQVVSCKDAIAQEYLMESLIQVFPDEFHLSTLNPFLSSCAQLAPDVKVKNIIIALVDRLASSHDIHLPDDLFDNFSTQISNIISNRTTVPIEDIITMQGSLINFSLKKIADPVKREESINSVLGATLAAIKDMQVVSISLRTSLGKEMFRFLKLPFNLSASMSDPAYAAASGATSEFGLVKMSLKLTHFKDLLKETCDIELHKQIILTLLNETLENYCEDQIRLEDRLTPAEIHTFLTELCAPLVNGSSEVVVAESGKSGAAVAVVDEQSEDFIDEQLLLSRFIHFLLLPQCIDSGETSTGNSDSTQLLDTTYLTLNSIRKILATGGPSRIRHTFPSLVFEALQLSLRYASMREEDGKWMKKCQKIYQFVNQLIMGLMKESNCADLCLRLFLEAALNASKSEISNFESISYEFISQAFSIYEEEISDSKEQTLCLLLIISTVKSVKFDNLDNFSPLRNQCCLNCGKLVKVGDRCRAILAASTLFVDDKQSKLEPEIMKCFKKCLKILDNMLDGTLQLQLYVEILSNLTLYVKYGNDEVNELIRVLAQLVADKRNDTAIPELVSVQYSNSIHFLEQNGLHVSPTA